MSLTRALASDEPGPALGTPYEEHGFVDETPDREPRVVQRGFVLERGEGAAACL